MLLTLQEGLGYSPVKAGAVTLGFAAALAIGSARSAAVGKRLGSRVLLLGCALMICGQLGVMGVLDAVGTGLQGWQLLLPMVIAGAGGGFFIAPVTSVVLGGISSRDAGAASGALATAQQVGAALGIAIVGVIFFGLVGTNKVETAVLANATPAARLDDFTPFMRVTLWWQIAAFAIALALCARLPRVRLDADTTVAGTA